MATPVSDDQTEAIYQRFSGQLSRFVSSRISDPDDVKDILQDVFLKIHTRLGTLEEVTRLQSWIYQIARNTVVDFYRSRKALPHIEEVDEIPDTKTIEDAGARLAHGLREMVDELPEPYREAIRLVEFEGMSQKDLAERLGISFSGAKSRVQRGRSMLRDILNRCCHFELDRFGAVIDYHPISCCCCQQDGKS